MRVVPLPTIHMVIPAYQPASGNTNGRMDPNHGLCLGQQMEDSTHMSEGPLVATPACDQWSIDVHHRMLGNVSIVAGLATNESMWRAHNEKPVIMKRKKNAEMDPQGLEQVTHCAGCRPLISRRSRPHITIRLCHVPHASAGEGI